MKKYLLILMILLGGRYGQGQSIIVEGLAGHRYLFYQHLAFGGFKKESASGWMHIANAASFYETNKSKGGRSNELMNQAYLTYRFARRFTLLGGMFYNNVSGIRPSLGLQYGQPFKNGLLVVVPRINVERRGPAEIMAMLEYQPALKKGLKLYSRLQLMSNYGPAGHNRSYQRIRLGIDIRGTQLGAGINLDEYGKERGARINAGIFLRRPII